MAGIGETEAGTYTTVEVRAAMRAVLVASQPLVMRPLALACENEGWDTKVVPFEALNPSLLKGASLVIVNPDDGLGLVQRVYAAVGDRTGTVTLYRHAQQSWSTSVAADRGGSPVEVPATTVFPRAERATPFTAPSSVFDQVAVPFSSKRDTL